MLDATGAVAPKLGPEGAKIRNDVEEIVSGLWGLYGCFNNKCGPFLGVSSNQEPHYLGSIEAPLIVGQFPFKAVS